MFIKLRLFIISIHNVTKKMDEEEQSERGGVVEATKQTMMSSSSSSASEQEPEELLDPITLTLLVPPLPSHHFVFVSTSI
jgi:hypothetical protein